MEDIGKELGEWLRAQSYVSGSDRRVERLKNARVPKMTWEQLRDQAAKLSGGRVKAGKARS